MLNIMHRRSGTVYFLTVVSMFLIILRVINIALDVEYSAAANGTATRSITVTQQRGTIFDADMKPITNSRNMYVGVITDTPSAVITLKNYYSDEETAEILAEVKNGNTPIIYTDRDITGNGISCFLYKKHAQAIANHLIGYTDQSGHGVSGLQKAFDEILYSDETVKLNFSIDGHGNIIKGDSLNFTINGDIEKSGIATTIDTDIQIIAENAADSLNQGAVVVAEAKTGEIKAIVSRPNFELNNLNEALENPDLPLLNRAFLTYNVGSIFKPVIATAAIEKGVNGYLWFCEGYSDIDGQVFKCHKTDGHGWLDLDGAIKYSCNAFFYNLAVSVGAERIYKIAERAGFNNSVSLAEGVITKKSQIGDLNKLSISDRALANLAIGQGELMISPVGMLTLYSAIATDGSYFPLKLIRGEVQNGELVNSTADSEKIKLMNSSTAKIIRESLLGVFDEGGTGYSARPQNCTAAGKTSTAQTGIVKDGKSVINSWFCGFFPYDNPQYVVVVLSENSSKSCTEVFSKIADEIAENKKAEN